MHLFKDVSLLDSGKLFKVLLLGYQVRIRPFSVCRQSDTESLICAFISSLDYCNFLSSTLCQSKHILSGTLPLWEESLEATEMVIKSA